MIKSKGGVVVIPKQRRASPFIVDSFRDAAVVAAAIIHSRVVFPVAPVGIAVIMPVRSVSVVPGSFSATRHPRLVVARPYRTTTMLPTAFHYVSLIDPRPVPPSCCLVGDL
jgi:hypothetical protein